MPRPGTGQLHCRPRAAPTLAEVVAACSAPRVVGVEREFTVARGGLVIDGRTVWPQLPDIGAALDPGDPRARRDPWGGATTLDGRHLEAATRPVPLEPGCTQAASLLAVGGARHLADALPRGHALVGYSTHLSVEVDDDRVVQVARIVAERLSVPLALALDRRDSPGLLVRPRRGRLEICGEFAAGEQLQAALALAVGVTLLAQRSAGLGRILHRLPRTPRIRPAPSVERFGWYVDRAAHGPDLYLDGRRTHLGATTAGAVLERVWTAARALSAGLLAAEELHLVDALVDGDLPLPLEQPLDDPVIAAAALGPRRDYGRRCRGEVEICVTAATWWRAVIELRSPSAVRWVTIPGRALDGVLDAVDAGTLDGDLDAILTASP